MRDPITVDQKQKLVELAAGPLSYGAIAHEMGLPYATVYNHVSKARHARACQPPRMPQPAKIYSVENGVTRATRELGPVAVLQRRPGEKKFADMVTTVRPALMAFAFNRTQSKDEAEEIVSQTVIKLLENESKFVPGTNFPAWATTICRNVFLDSLRRAKPEVPLLITLDDGSETDRPDLQMQTAPMQESTLHAQDMARVMNETLTLHAKDMLKRAVHDGDSYVKIARETGVSEGTVKSRICRACEQLEKGMEKPRAPEPAPVSGNTGAIDQVLKMLLAERIRIDRVINDLRHVRARLVL